MLFVVPFRFGRASNYNSAKTATIEQLTILSRDLHKTLSHVHKHVTNKPVILNISKKTLRRLIPGNSELPKP